MYKVTVPVIITNGHFNKEKVLEQMRRCGAERIALALDRELKYKFSSKENLKLLEELIKYYKDNGLEVLVWLGETFGHDGGAAVDKYYTHIRFIDKGDINAFCPMDESFADDICNWVVNAAKCGAELILLDDDFRLGYRDGLGCCCDLHMAALEAELGESVSLENLREKLFCGGKNKYRDAWMKVQGDSMRSIAKKLRNALDTISPDIRLGFCCPPSAWDAEGRENIELAQIMAGKNKPFIRACGAPYWATPWQGHILGEIVEFERTQFDWCKDIDIEVISEGDTYPRPRFVSPAAHLECFDMILRADGRSDGILKYMLDYVSDADYETGYVDAMVKHRDLYDLIEKHFSKKRCIGVRPYNVMHLLENAELKCDDEKKLIDLQNGLFYPSLRFAAVNSLPISYEAGNVNILFGENARYITKTELKNGNIIDITAARILQKRGIDVGIESFEERKSHRQEGFTDLPCEYYIDEDVYTRLSGGVALTNAVVKKGARLLTQYKAGQNIYNGVFEYENADGMRFLVYPFDAEQAKKVPGWFNTYARRRQAIKSIEWLGKKPLEAYVDGNYPNLYIMAKKDENSISVGLWNLFDDAIDNARIAVNMCGDDIGFINCRGHREGGKVVLDTTLYPYEFAAFELKIKG